MKNILLLTISFFMLNSVFSQSNNIEKIDFIKYKLSKMKDINKVGNYTEAFNKIDKNTLIEGYKKEKNAYISVKRYFGGIDLELDPESYMDFRYSNEKLIHISVTIHNDEISGSIITIFVDNGISIDAQTKDLKTQEVTKLTDEKAIKSIIVSGQGVYDYYFTEKYIPQSIK